MTPTERVAIREAQAQLDSILDEPRAVDSVLHSLLNQLAEARESERCGAGGSEHTAGAVDQLVEYWGRNA